MRCIHYKEHLAEQHYLRYEISNKLATREGLHQNVQANQGRTVLGKEDLDKFFKNSFEGNFVEVKRSTE